MSPFELDLYFALRYTFLDRPDARIRFEWERARPVLVAVVTEIVGANPDPAREPIEPWLARAIDDEPVSITPQVLEARAALDSYSIVRFAGDRGFVWKQARITRRHYDRALRDRREAILAEGRVSAERIRLAAASRAALFG